MARVFLTGGSGFIGGELISALLERGDEVVALAHSTWGAEQLAKRPEVEVVRGDVLDPATLKLDGCELVYHVAGVNSHCPKNPDYLLKTNVEGTENVLRAAVGAGVKRVVYTSSAASVGEAHGSVGREDTRHRGSYLSVYDRSKHVSEQRAFAIAEQTGLEVVALNPSSVQGPPRKGGNGAIIIAFLNGKLKAFVSTHVSVVDVQDVVQAHILAAERGASGERYILNGATIHSTEALRIVTELSGIDDKVPLVPHVVARTLIGGLDHVFKLRGKVSPICKARIETILHGHQYDGSKATRELGLEYTSVKDTFERTMHWAVDEGLVTRPLPKLVSKA